MVYSRFFSLITSLFYVSTKSEGGNLRKSHSDNFVIAKDFIPKNLKDTFFISYKNNVRKDIKYKDGKFDEFFDN